MSRRSEDHKADDIIPLSELDVSEGRRFQDDSIWGFFDRLRREDPVHYCKDSPHGPYWSVTKYRDIVAVDTNHKAFSSKQGVTIVDVPDKHWTQSFIKMGPPKHAEQRNTVSPIVGPESLTKLETLIRSRVRAILDGLPRNEAFNWVDMVSIELTTQMLATLFDFPFEDRRLLTYWSDVAVTTPKAGHAIDSWDKRSTILSECLDYFTKLWNERINAEPRLDLISLMAHSPATRHMKPSEFLGNLILLIVGGNDTTRNSITGGLLFMSQYPSELRKLADNPKLVSSAVSEIIRYQTPIAHMRRTAAVDSIVGGKQIRKGDKVVMWYISGNRDEEIIENANSFVIDRKNVRQHLSFGFGIHRCLGRHLAELQLRVLWEEILDARLEIEVVGEPERIASNFVHGYSALPVRIEA
ncbi:cytochrome P450 [Bradyrhizobium sp. IC3069]|uniref:cytochrome P450 n=1 Tax=Bradyrhizobium TaxID=374 RepID=UPI001CD4D94A|nr:MULTISPECIES: cytochrome P450 [Bradyrhizobium]MCA1363436.1 cytochrome P450 [Bradyrhizobium sp. IC4059]MCA1411064.1 cytochrome P450 [Bradyrhizobium sp. NBAIM20]MCA1463907.1 cytochrome P450 [Bradyrhizobium sp. NBAIM18]MCA1520974.1 cytochrome P450 [Bradyrhizobium sp. IC3069]MCA1528708.1 cytochrome P450 [Bradyrhizobium yuanmingense]